jgi:superfamily II DNA/RNA helicase
LANQIAKEAKGLLHFHPFKVVTFVGGIPLPCDHASLSLGIDLLVATPGRLVDHLNNTRGFAQQMQKVSVFVLDEADQMLEMGF